ACYLASALEGVAAEMSGLERQTEWILSSCASRVREAEEEKRREGEERKRERAAFELMLQQSESEKLKLVQLTVSAQSVALGLMEEHPPPEAIEERGALGGVEGVEEGAMVDGAGALSGESMEGKLVHSHTQTDGPALPALPMKLSPSSEGGGKRGCFPVGGESRWSEGREELGMIDEGGECQPRFHEAGENHGRFHEGGEMHARLQDGVCMFSVKDLQDSAYEFSVKNRQGGKDSTRLNEDVRSRLQVLREKERLASAAVLEGLDTLSAGTEEEMSGKSQAHRMEGEATPDCGEADCGCLSKFEDLEDDQRNPPPCRSLDYEFGGITAADPRILVADSPMSPLGGSVDDNLIRQNVTIPRTIHQSGW
ncbi:MAG: hypothetical protein SGPRY_005191, partial [Prymnesium sp.]